MADHHKLTTYASHCKMMAKQYDHAHPRWLWYSTMARAKEIQARYWRNRSPR